jgi:hypothetical protein
MKKVMYAKENRLSEHFGYEYSFTTQMIVKVKTTTKSQYLKTNGANQIY